LSLSEHPSMKGQQADFAVQKQSRVAGSHGRGIAWVNERES